MKAYMAVIKAETGLLLGGGKRHVSAPFVSREDAKAWARQALDTNLVAGRKPVLLYTINEVESLRPIPVSEVSQ